MEKTKDDRVLICLILIKPHKLDSLRLNNNIHSSKYKTYLTFLENFKKAK